MSARMPFGPAAAKIRGVDSFAPGLGKQTGRGEALTHAFGIGPIDSTLRFRSGKEVPVSKAISSPMKRSGSDTSDYITVSRMDLSMRLQGYVGVIVTIALATYLCIIMPLQDLTRSLAMTYLVLFVMWLFFVDVCIFALIGMHRMKIVTSPWGIEYYGMARTVRAPWSDVVRVDTVRSGYQNVDALILRRQPDTSPVMRALSTAGGILRPLKWIIAVAGGNWGLLGQDVDTDKLQQAVPLGYLATDWQSSELGSAIKR